VVGDALELLRLAQVDLKIAQLLRGPLLRRGLGALECRRIAVLVGQRQRLRTSAGHSGPERDAGGFARRDSHSAPQRNHGIKYGPGRIRQRPALADANRIARLAAPAQKSGSVGLELAQAFRRLGAEVTVLEAVTPLASDDPECAAIVLDALDREGVKLRTGVEIKHVRRALARVAIDIMTPAGAETIEGSHLLVAAGRRPNVEELDLDAARIRYEPHGIIVDKRLRTTNKRVYAVGDVTVGPKLTHLANYHAELVIRHALFRQRVSVDHHAIPTVTHTDPELAQVGLVEDEARAHSGVIRVLRWPYCENDRAQTTQATNGHIKVVTDRRGDILGATIVGAAAGENIAAWTLAITQKLNIRAFAGLVVPYPAYAEVGKRAAMTYFMRGLTSFHVRRIIGWLRRLG